MDGFKRGEGEEDASSREDGAVNLSMRRDAEPRHEQPDGYREAHPEGGVLYRCAFINLGHFLKSQFVCNVINDFSYYPRIVIKTMFAILAYPQSDITTSVARCVCK